MNYSVEDSLIHGMAFCPAEMKRIFQQRLPQMPQTRVGLGSSLCPRAPRIPEIIG